MAPLHEWWKGFGQALPDAAAAGIGRAREAAAFVASGAIPGVALVEARHTAGGSHVALHLDIEVERPQDLACDIRAVEPVAVVFGAGGHAPSVLALRADFPDTMHQNAIPSGFPRSLCVDDRPWAEAQLTFTVADFIRRIQLWLAKAAKGELHDPAQPLEPLFFGSALKILVPRAALAEREDPAELIGFAHPDNPDIVVTRLVGKDVRADGHPNGFVVVPLRAAPQQTGRLRQSPATLAALAAELAQCGVDLGAEIARRVIAWAGLQKDDLRRLSSRLAIIAAFPVEGADGKTADDLRAFVTESTAGEVGAALGVIERNVSDVGSGSGYVRLIGVKEHKPVPALDIVPAEVHLDFSRDLGAAIGGQEAPDTRAAVMIGAGSLGSQVAVNLAREGRFQWTLVDNDALLPHNLARHALFSSDVGLPKAIAVARRMHGLLDEPIGHLACNVLAPSDNLKEALADRLKAADIILDASASIAVSRYVADLPDASGRRLSLFFNPAGTAVVLLSEGTGRDVTLRDLESQYHRILRTEAALADHLQPRARGLRYSGSCRAVTNRISASQAALLSAIAARGITAALKEDDAAIRIWSVSDESEVRLHLRRAAEVKRVTLGDWIVTYDTNVEAEVAALRDRNLPRETGGVLLGISDTSRRSIHIVSALPQPDDSQGSVTRFERGVAGLQEVVAAAAEASLHQVRYVGEWHSHPAGSSTMPSTIDLSQLCWLTEELENEGLPALMAIAGDHGAITLLLGGRQRGAPDGARKECA